MASMIGSIKWKTPYTTQYINLHNYHYYQMVSALLSVNVMRSTINTSAYVRRNDHAQVICMTYMLDTQKQ
jgi:hypothetical protein